MQKSDSISNLAEALALAQGEFEHVPFDAVNPFLKNQYATLGAVIETAKPIMAKYGLSVTQLVTDQGGIGVETVLMHRSGEWLATTISLPLGDEKGKSLAQVAGSIVTYLRRYALAGVLGLYADADTDGNQPEQEPAKGSTVSKPAGKPVPPKPQDDRPWYEKAIAMARADAKVYGSELGKTDTGKLAISRLYSVEVGKDKVFQAKEHVTAAISKYTGYAAAEDMTWDSFTKLMRIYHGPLCLPGEQVKDVLFMRHMKPSDWQAFLASIPLETDMVLDEQTATALESALVSTQAFVKDKKLDVHALADNVRAHFIKVAVPEEPTPQVDIATTDPEPY